MASNTQYEKLKKKTLAKAQQNRKNRVERLNKQYGNKTSKSQQAYIAGDVLSSASMKAYAYKKNPSYMPKQSLITGGRSKSNYAKLQKGENPYEAKYVWTGKPTVVKGGTRADGSTYDSFISKKRMLTDDEKKMWEAQGSLDKKKYDQNYKYHWFDNYNKDAKTFKEHSNLTQDGKMLWDGMKVANNRVANGGSKWNYLGGFLKDTLIDGGIEAIRHLDRISSAGTGAVAGLFEESANLIKGDVDWNRPLKNIKESLQQSEETGWGKGLSEFFDDANKRNVEKDVAYYKEMQKGLSKNSDAYKHYESLIKNAENTLTDGKHKTFRSVTGFIGDVKNPIEVGDALVSGLKGATKLAAKSGKELLSGTADLSTAFKSKDELSKIAFEHQDMLNRMSAYKKYLQEEYVPYLKKTGKKFDDVEAERLFEDSSYAREYAERSGNLANNIDQRINHSLDKGYSNAIANDTKQIVNEVKSNPGTKNLGNFLDEIGDNVDNGKQLSIDGRTLNKNKTQTKDGYIPQFVDNTDDVIDNMNVDKNQLSMFNRNGNTNTYEKSIKPNSNRFEKWYNSYKNKDKLYDMEDDLFDMIDGLSDSDADGMLDWLSKNKPDVYSRYMGDIDDVDTIADDGVRIFDSITKRDNNIVKNVIHNAKRTSNKPVYDANKTDLIKEENAIEKILSIFDGNTNKKTYKNLLERRNAFTNHIDSFSKKIFDNEIDIEEVSKTIQKIKGRDIPPKVKREFINNFLFDGEDVIAPNAGNGSLDDLLANIEDVLSLKGVVDEYSQTGEVLPVKLSDSTKSFLGVGDDLKVIGSKVRGRVSNSPEELLSTLLNSIVDRSRGITDNRYAEKLQLMAKELGYENFNRDVKNKTSELKKELKILDKMPFTKEVANKKLEISSELNSLKEVEEKREKMWSAIRNLPENSFDKYISEQYPQHMKDMKPYSYKSKNVKDLDNMSGYNQAVREVKSNYYDEIAKTNRDDIITDSRRINNTDEPQYSTRDKKADIEKLRKSENIEEREYASKVITNVRKELNLQYVDFKKINVPDKTKQTYKNLTKTKGVKDALENIKKLITKEATLRVNGLNKDANIVRGEMKYFVKKLKEVGVYEPAWFNEMKNYKMSLFATAPTKADIFEKTGLSINNKIGGLSKEAREYMSLKLQGAKTVDELFSDEYFEEIFNGVAKHGDNTGDGVSSLLRPNKNEVNNKGTEPMVKQMDEQMVEPMDEQIVEQMVKGNKPELGKIYDEIPDDFNPFSMFDKDEVIKVAEEKPKIRRKRTKEELDEINATLERFKDVPSVKKYNVSKGEMPKTTLEQPKFDQFKEWFNDKEMPYDENVLYDTYKRWLNSWKKGLTVYNPGWHVQNYFQNKGQNYLALGDKAFGSQKQARNVLKEIKGEVGNGDMILTKNGKTYSQKDMADLAKRYDVVEGQADNIIESRGIFAPLETKVDNSWIMNKLSESEETARLHHFITQIERGMSPEEASKSVNKYLYDYSKQNKADRLMSDFVDPFWTFHKNNARLMTSQAIENPQRIAKINRGIRGLQNDVDGEDKALEQRRSIQSPIGSFKDEVNEDTYNYQYDLNLFPSYEGSIPLEKDDVENKLNPLVKIAKQQMEGVGNFGNKITDKEVSGYNEVTKDERALEILREVNPFMNPLVKALYNSSKHQEKADEEKQSQKASNKQILATWLEYIFGSKGNYYRDVR